MTAVRFVAARLLLDWPWRSLAGAVAVTVACFWYADGREGAQIHALSDQGTREALYASIAGTTGALLGFVLAALTILMALPPGRKIDFLREAPDWPAIPAAFVRAAWLLFGALISFTTLILTDTGTKPSYHWETFAAAMAACAVVAVLGTVVALGSVVRLAVSDKAAQGRP
jgi:hypothetical protein